MNYFRRLSFTNLVVFISLFFIFTLTFLWIYETSLTYEREIDRFKTLKFEQKKELVKNEVSNAIDFIKYKKENSENELKKIMQEKVNDAYTISFNIYNKFKDKKNKDEILDIIKESLRQMRFFEGRGYFFVLNLKGTTMLHPIFPQHEGTRFLETHKDVRGSVLHDVFKNIALSKNGEGFTEYYFYRTDDKKQEAKKIGFVKYFEPFNLYIGTAEYIEDFEKIVQKEVLKRLREKRFAQNGYLFISDFNGLVLMNPLKKEIEGENLLNYQDKNGVFVVKELINAASKPSGDFVYYLWTKPDSNEEAEKFSFAKGFKPWGWVLGAGNYVEDIDSEIIYKSLNEKSQLRKRISTMGIVLIVLTLSLLFFMMWWNKRTNASINEFISFFEKAGNNNIRINENEVLFKEFKKMAAYINNMLESKESLQKELEILAITDKLTGIYNRLKLDEIIQNEISRRERYKHDLSITILDIDHFKNVNDNFGHQIGDKVLIEIVEILKENIRKVDFIGRWGGEEFVIICPETNIEGNIKLVEILRKKIELKNINPVGNITASFGSTSYKDGDTAESILKRADDALYEAKNSGRNKTVVF